MNNATWIPEAGGYVYNGQIVSQKPIYDSNGKQIVTATMGQIKSPSNASQTINANNVQNQTGATISETATANKPNTNMQTAIGSLGTTNNNTATSGTAVSSPATNSPQTNAQAQDPVQKYITDYSTALANQDLNGQINALIELDKYTVSQGGVPQYSEVIGNLQKQNTEQVTNTVNEYANQIAEATRTGNTALAEGLKQELASFKQENDYASVLENRKAEIETEYSFAYMQGINDITSGILSLLGQYNNFQYDPYSDPALQMAQGYAVSSVKEQMNSTGMYYSSMTQSAITRAINELIPVYEQMAKEEILENINLLQSTASYLLNLEKAQFDMWASQIEMQILKNQEKRAEIEHAWDRVNNLGYVDNEASLVLGVDVGTLSPEIRKMMLNEEMNIRAEERALKIEKQLARYSQDLAMEKMAKEQEYAIALENLKLSNDKDLAQYKASLSDSTTSGGTLNSSDLKKYVEGLSNQNVSKYDIMTEALLTGEDENISKAVIATAYDEENMKYIFNNELLSEIGVETYHQILKLTQNYKTKEEVMNNIDNIVKDVETKVANKELTNEQALLYLAGIGEDTLYDFFEENSEGYSSNTLGGESQKAVKDSTDVIEEYANAIMKSNIPNVELAVAGAYEELFRNIAGADDTFDYYWYWGDEGKKAKAQAIKDVIEKVKKENKYGNKTSAIVSELRNYANTLVAQGKIDESGLE